MTTERFGHTATLLTNGQVLVVGGEDVSGAATAATELFDPNTDTWTNTNAMHDAREVHTATLLANGEVLVTGGAGPDEPHDSTELYDPVTSLWETNNAMNDRRFGHTATLLPDGRVLVAGGYDGHLPSAGSWLASAEIYDPVAGDWTLTNSLINARSGHTATLLANGQVLIAGGVQSNTLVSSAELFDPSLGLWLPAGTMIAGRRLHTATLLPNGKVLIAGGAGDGNDVPVAELYDPSTKTWTTNGALNLPRNSHTATLMPDGKVLVAGGWPLCCGYAATAEVYDADEEAWTLTSQLNAARAYHTANLLPSGKILVAGGFGDGAVLSSTELYVESAPFSLVDPIFLTGGVFQFGFANTPGASFSALSASNPSLPLSNWTVLGVVTEVTPGQFQFTDLEATNSSQRFYRVRAN